MTVYDDVVLIVGLSLILVGVIWLLCYKLDKWLEIRVTQKRTRAITEDIRKRLGEQ